MASTLAQFVISQRTFLACCRALTKNAIKMCFWASYKLCTVDYSLQWAKPKWYRGEKAYLQFVTKADVATTWLWDLKQNLLFFLLVYTVCHSVCIFWTQYIMVKLISSQSLNLGSHRGTTDDIATTSFHPSLSSAAPLMVKLHCSNFRTIQWFLGCPNFFLYNTLTRADFSTCVSFLYSSYITCRNNKV